VTPARGWSALHWRGTRLPVYPARLKSPPDKMAVQHYRSCDHCEPVPQKKTSLRPRFAGISPTLAARSDSRTVAVAAAMNGRHGVVEKRCFGSALMHGSPVMRLLSRPPLAERGHAAAHPACSPEHISISCGVFSRCFPEFQVCRRLRPAAATTVIAVAFRNLSSRPVLPHHIIIPRIASVTSSDFVIVSVGTRRRQVLLHLH